MNSPTEPVTGMSTPTTEDMVRDSKVTEAFVPANDPKQKLGVRQRAIFAAEWAAGLAIGTVLCPFVSPVFALILAFQILDGMRTLPLVLKFPLGIVITILLIPVMLIPAWVICAVLGHEMVSARPAEDVEGKYSKTFGSSRIKRFSRKWWIAN